MLLVCLLFSAHVDALVAQASASPIDGYQANGYPVILREGDFEADIDRLETALYRYTVYKSGPEHELLFSGYEKELDDAIAAAKAHLQWLRREGGEASDSFDRATH